MTEPYRQSFRARWADMDFNQHMSNHAYLGCAEEARMGYLDSHGWPMAKFAEQGIGPVVLEDRLTYRKELRLLEPFTVDLALAGATSDVRKMRVRNTFQVSDGAVAAVVNSLVIWFDLVRRGPVTPPEDLRNVWLALPRTDDFQDMDAVRAA